MKHAIDKEKNSITVKRMYSIFTIGVLPLLLFLICFISNQHSATLNNLSVFADRYPEILSSKNLVLSSVMGLYIKTAPLFGIIFFYNSYKELKLNKVTSTINLYITLLVFSLFYISLLTIASICNVDITEGGRLLQLLSSNDYFLTAFYISVFYIMYISTSYYLCFIYALCKILKPA